VETALLNSLRINQESSETFQPIETNQARLRIAFFRFYPDFFSVAGHHFRRRYTSHLTLPDFLNICVASVVCTVTVEDCAQPVACL
jgi:hypothetical protein